MKCPNCGTKNHIGASFCGRCQWPLTEKKSGKYKFCPHCFKKFDCTMNFCPDCKISLKSSGKSKAPVIIGICSGLVVAGLSAFIICAYPIYTMNQAITQKNIEKIDKISQKHPNLITSEKFAEKYEDLISEATDDYIAENTDFDTTITNFGYFSDINKNAQNTEWEDLRSTEEQKVREINLSRQNFETAETAYYSRNYQQAENKYGDVSADDEKYYELAQERLDSLATMKENVISNAQEAADNEDYDSAINIYTTGLDTWSYDSIYTTEYRCGIVKVVIA